MPSFLTRWMTAQTLDDETTRAFPSADSRDGGEYARELRDVARRLRCESDLDLEEPSRDLRYRTLDRLHEVYAHQRPRIRPGTPHVRTTLKFPTPLRRSFAAAACMALVVGSLVVADRYGSTVFDEVASSLNRSTASKEAPPTQRVAGLPIGDDRYSHAASNTNAGQAGQHPLFTVLGTPVQEHLSEMRDDARRAAALVFSTFRRHDSSQNDTNVVAGSESDNTPKSTDAPDAAPKF